MSLSQNIFIWSVMQAITVSVAGKYCQSDGDCDSRVGEVCWWTWEGCTKGECMCDPRTSMFDSSTRKCSPLKYGGEQCSAEDRCWEGMSCTDGYCRCDEGTMTSDRMFCLRDNERLLGQSCNKETDTCFQRTIQQYDRTDVHCSSGGRCRCNHGYKQDGNSCIQYNIGESGCARDHNCQGGALCMEGTCKCPNTYYATADNTKCARNHAFHVNLKMGQSCKEMEEQAYCAYDLECRPCPTERHHTCVRYKLPYANSSTSNLHTSITWFLTGVLIVLMSHITLLR